jgi:hypothetical protein
MPAGLSGPRSLTGGKIIAPFGSQISDIPLEAGSLRLVDYIDADGPEQIRIAVRKNLFYGADLIKLGSEVSASCQSGRGCACLRR